MPPTMTKDMQAFVPFVLMHAKTLDFLTKEPWKREEQGLPKSSAQCTQRLVLGSDHLERLQGRLRGQTVQPLPV